MEKYEKFESKIQPGEYLDFLEYVPEGGEAKKPLLIHIHGAGSRGSDITKMAIPGAIQEIRKGRELDVIVVAPQCRHETWFDTFPVLAEFIETNIKRPGVDPDRVYIMGVSMGGYTTWLMCQSHPEWFAAAVPICGGGMYWNAKRLVDLPIWAFHGARDQTVLPEESLKMVSAVNRNGGKAKLTIFPQDPHNSWDSTYASDDMWEWLFQQRRGGKA